MKTRYTAIIILLAIATLSFAADPAAPAKPSGKDKCPVCGMFVYKYPDWVTAVTTKDGKTYYYDGAKDMFRHLAEMPGDSVARAWVTEYYGLTMIQASKAFYVIGSNVYGPMGHELVPFATRQEAEEFMSDHKGRAVLVFSEITAEIIKGLK